MAALRPEQAQMLTDIDRWNAYARRMNQKAIAAGVVDAATVAANRRASEQARRDLLNRWEVTHAA